MNNILLINDRLVIENNLAIKGFQVMNSSSRQMIGILI